MIIVENINEKLIKHYSDKNVYIRQVETGIEYSSAVDVVPCRYTYEETDREIEISNFEDSVMGDVAIAPLS